MGVQTIDKTCSYSNTTVVFSRNYGHVYVTQWVISSLKLLSHMRIISTCATPGAQGATTKAERGISSMFDARAEQNHCATAM